MSEPQAKQGMLFFSKQKVQDFNAQQIAEESLVKESLDPKLFSETQLKIDNFEALKSGHKSPFPFKLRTSLDCCGVNCDTALNVMDWGQQ